MQPNLSKKLLPDEFPNTVPSDVLVSVSMITYKHEPYIAKAIEGVLMQKTNFAFELCIGEDDSPDGTRAICKEYALKYPEKIRLFERSRKDVIYIDGKPTGRANGSKTRGACVGKYRAICEGDDYWIDPLKLQKQFDFLEANPDYSMCFHSGFIEDACTGERISDRWLLSSVSRSVSMKEMILNGGNMCPTNSLFFRREVSLQMPDFMRECPVGDAPLQAMCSILGKVYFMAESMSVYRTNVAGSWTSSLRADFFVSIKHLGRIMLFYKKLIEYIGGKYRWSITVRMLKKVFRRGAIFGRKRQMSFEAFLSETRKVDLHMRGARSLMCLGFLCGQTVARLRAKK